jgi:lipoprotein LprG
MSARRALVGPLVALIALLSACSSETLPDGAQTLTKSAETMSTIKSTHFVITVDGDLPELGVQGAEGDLNADGDAKGRAKTNQFGQLLEVDFVLVKGDLYIKGPTGGFQKLPDLLKNQVYDPTAILNPDKGIAKVLRSVKDPKTQSADGDTTVVAGTVPKDVAAALVPGINSDVAATFTLDKASLKLQQARFALKGKDGKDASVEVALSEYDKLVKVSPPA